MQSIFNSSWNNGKLAQQQKQTKGLKASKQKKLEVIMLKHKTRSTRLQEQALPSALLPLMLVIGTSTEDFLDESFTLRAWVEF